MEDEAPSILPTIFPGNKLTIKQLRFVENYVRIGDGTKAAIKAGYSPRSASTSASTMLDNPLILEAIERVSAAVNLTNEPARNRIEQELYEVILSAKVDGNTMVLLKALDMLCKVHGLYAPGVQLTQDQSITINYIVPDGSNN
jgi:phage terminase small subunit